MPIITQFNIMRRVPLPMLEGQSLAVYYCICVFVLRIIEEHVSFHSYSHRQTS